MHEHERKQKPVNEALFPYAGTDGHSGTETSKQAAEDHHETAGDKQNAVLNALAEKKARGLTVVDVRNTLIPHHGTASRVLSVLHVGGRILRLKERRDGSKVYVLPQYQMTRPIERYIATKSKHRRAALIDARSALERLRSTGTPSPLVEYQMGWDAACSAALADVQELLDTLEA